MKAQYVTRCQACGELILAGEPIHLAPGLEQWEHVTCPDPAPEAQRDVCPGCFTERAVNGRCMCP